MKLQVSLEEQVLINGFVQICTNPDYLEGNLKRYRILYFTYMIGCIGPDELAFLFQKEKILNHVLISEQRNFNRAMLNGLAKTSKVSDAKLKRLENGYYIITSSGIKHLVFHLIEKGIVSNDMYDYYVKHVSYRYVNCQHACMLGRALLSYLQYQADIYLIEPALTENGELLFCVNEDMREAYLIPDGIMAGEDGEIFFIESDSGHERMKTKLVPKIQRYVSVCKETDTSELLLTLHFYLWDFKDSKKPCELDMKVINELYSLYDFQINYLHNELSFSDFLSAIIAYPVNNNSILSSIQKILSGLELKQINCVEDLKKACIEQMLIDGEKPFIISRKKTLEHVLKYVPEFEEYLRRGMRYICTTSNTTNEVLKCIYFKNDMVPIIGKLLCNNNVIIDGVIDYKKIKKYRDSITGELYWFRNVIEYIISGTETDIIIENVCDDFGGKIRVERLINEFKINIKKELIFILITNETNNIKFGEKIKFINKKFKTFILSYSEWILLNGKESEKCKSI